MPRFAANLSLLYPELPFLDRFAAAADDGFRGVEFLFPYAFDSGQLAARLRDNDLQQVLFNASPGNWDAGDRGLACLPGREAEFRASVEQALAYAHVLGCPRIHVMAGVCPPAVAAQQLRRTYVDNLRWAARVAATHGVQLLMEPINPRDMPGYYLQRQDVAHQLRDEVAEPNVLVQMDLYHCQIVEGDLTQKLHHYLPTGRVGHIQIAGVPERHEPDSGELNYAHLLALLDALGYPGWVGCEYRPRQAGPGGTHAGLSWLKTLVAAV